MARRPTCRGRFAPRRRSADRDRGWSFIAEALSVSGLFGVVLGNLLRRGAGILQSRALLYATAIAMPLGFIGLESD